MKKYIYDVNMNGEDAPAKILKLVGSNKRVLEIGCASGVQTRILRDLLNCSVVGIDIDAQAAEQAREYCDSILIGDIESLNFKDSLGEDRFDVITIADVLEHLKHPGDVLKNLRPFLKEDGYILASIPNVVHAGLILEMIHGRFDYRPYGLLDDTHIRFFTLKSIHRLFEQSDLEITQIDRALRSIDDSEFIDHTLSFEEKSIIKFIQENNPEWQTYQFIIKATIRQGQSEPNNSLALDLKDSVRDRDLTIKSLEEKIKELESQLNWITSRPAYRTLARLKALFRKI